MNTESIIGLTAGIFGIVTGIAWLYGVLRPRIKAKSSKELFKELVNKDLSDAQKRKILVKLNKKSIIKDKIKNEYINNFKWSNKTISKILLDICEKNEIELTDDVCYDLLGERWASLQKEYKEKKQFAQMNEDNANVDNSTSITSENKSNHDMLKQKIYFSSYITSYKCWANIKYALESNNVAFALLNNTKDIWVRDFMPIYIDGHYVSYKYDPDYLQESKDYITKDINQVFDFSKDSLFSCNLVIDGGNVIVCNDKIIMTDKIFEANKNYSEDKVREIIEKAFGAKLVIIPWDKAEPYGHADGMVRFVSEDHVVINCYKDFDPKLRTELINALSPYFSNISELEYGSDCRADSWAHINYLQVDNLIFLPQMGIASDARAIEQFSRIFPNSIIIPVEVKGIVKKGGALNCVSWNHYE